MHPTLRICSSAARVHKPLIHFLGKRQWPSKPEAPHAHPAGSAEYKAHFSDFLKKFQSAGSKSQPSGATQKSQTASKDTGAYSEFWQAPSRLWNPRIRNISEEEMDAVLSGGASLH